MKAKYRTERFVTLELNETEVDWLTTQLRGKEREPHEQSKIRQEFLDSLNPPIDASGPGGRS